MKLAVVFSAILLVSCGHGPGPVVPETPVERQMIGLLEKFDRWDFDGSGELDQKEVAEGLKDRGTDYKAEQVISFYDTSGNGRISLREAQEGYSRADEVGLHLQN